MKRGFLIIILAAATALAGISCSSTGYNTQGGAAIGAGLGAIAGQAIGRNTAGTLIGAAGGALIGAIAGNAIDQDQANRRMSAMETQRAYARAAGPEDQPPGRWAQVPGQWVGGKWVPAHRVWVPVNPGPPAP